MSDKKKETGKAMKKARGNAEMTIEEAKNNAETRKKVNARMRAIYESLQNMNNAKVELIPDSTVQKDDEEKGKQSSDISQKDSTQNLCFRFERIRQSNSQSSQ